MSSTESSGWGFSVLAASVVFALLAFAPVGLDAWVHLSLGRVADSFGTVPDRNIFVYSMDASETVGILPWLGQWWMFKIHEALSWNGLLFMRSLLSGLAVLVALLATRASMIWVFVFAGLLPAFLNKLPVTPGIFGGSIWVMATALIVSVVIGRVSRYWLLLLPILSLPLVHIDGVFAVICVMTFWAAWKMQTRFGWGVAVATLVATLVNPRGLQVWVLAFSEFTVEWLPGAFVLLSGIAMILWSHLMRQDRAKWPLMALVAIFGSFRPEIAVFTVLVLGTLGFSEPSEVRFPAWRIPWWAAAGALLVAVLIQPLWAWWKPIPNSTKTIGGEQTAVFRHVPLESVRIIKSWGSRARVFNSPETAGLLMFELGEEPYPMLFTGPKELPELRNQLLNDLTISDREVRRGVFHQYGIRAALLQKRDDAPIVESLLEDPAWRLIHEEGDYVLFGR